MEQTLASGYIKKVGKLKPNKHIKEEITEYEGTLKVQDKEVTVNIFNDKNDNEIFVKISHKVKDSLYGML